MSPNISTLFAERADAVIRRLGGKAWRVVEAQHVISTRKLVDSAEEQEVLEGIIEYAKPPLPAADEFRSLHYLLTTPFRYPPLRHGSRFGTRTEPWLWYGSALPRTAFAETAYYRLLFLEGTAADIAPVTVELSLFHVAVRTSRGVDLTRPPFDSQRAIIASPTSYEATQSLGARMRESGVQAFRYPSARDVKGGKNLALFTPKAFAAKAPSAPETWYCVAMSQRVELTKIDVFEQRRLHFPRSDFEVDGDLPQPAP
jgi:hypothetical protein